MKNIICKNKFLVFNDDKKILLFLEEKNNKSKFFLPTIYTSKDEIVNSISPKILELININFENVELINDFHDEYFSYKKKNGKFELTKIVREKNIMLRIIYLQKMSMIAFIKYVLLKT